MSIISLRKRMTDSLDDYEKNKKSAKSLIYVSDNFERDAGSPDVLILTVGESYYSNSQLIAIPKKGMVIKPGECRIIETKQTISTPLNVIGAIYGIGTNIYQGGFVSPGKIDQGYNGTLKIAFFNGSKTNFTFKQGDILASAIFYSTEETLQAALSEQAYESCPSYTMLKKDKFKLFLNNNWLSIVSLAVAIFAVFVDFIK